MLTVQYLRYTGKNISILKILPGSTIISKSLPYRTYKCVSKALLSWSVEQVLFEHKKIVLNLNKTPHKNYWYYLSVFRIHWIFSRIRILGSVHWITNPALDPDSASFCQRISRCQQKLCFLSWVFCLLIKVPTLQVHLHQSSKITSH